MNTSYYIRRFGGGKGTYIFQKHIFVSEMFLGSTFNLLSVILNLLAGRVSHLESILIWGFKQ